MNTLSTTLREGRQFVAQLPAGMPLPKFDLFQQVSWKRWAEDRIQGHVIGLYWIDHNTALMERIAPGWHYMTSRIYGVTDTREVLNSDWEQSMLPEERLTTVEEAAS